MREQKAECKKDFLREKKSKRLILPNRKHYVSVYIQTYGIVMHICTCGCLHVSPSAVIPPETLSRESLVSMLGDNRMMNGPAGQCPEL